MNTLYYGDNLTIFREYIQDESVDLIYLDPPFKSDQDYNVLFAERDGARSVSQSMAFEDTWIWDQVAARAYQEIVESGPERVSKVMQAYRTFLGESDMLAYLSMMAPRLVEMKRVLKTTGTIYLHCDPTASHYLKLLMDAVFSPMFFLNEITWKRTYSHGNVSRNFGSICDTILIFSKSKYYTWNQQYVAFTEKYIRQTFTHQDPDGRKWQSVTLRNPGVRPNLHFPYTASNGISYKPHPNGWSCDVTRLKQYDRENRLHFPVDPGGALRLKMYLDESPGIKLQNLWTDIDVIGSQSKERLRYPTQKPDELLDRIIRTSSNPGDMVLDPFCGCGTAIAVAEELKRKWIGIDITQAAIVVIKKRLGDAFKQEVQYEVKGEPVSLPDAEALARQDPYQFQWWAIGLVGGTAHERRRGADRGIDGRIYFHDDPKGKTKQIIFSVKSGQVSVKDVRDLVGVVSREQAEIGVFLTLEKPTKPMKTEAASAGFYLTPLSQKFSRIQILTIAEVLAGKRVDYPLHNVTFKTATRVRPPKAENGELPF